MEENILPLAPFTRIFISKRGRSRGARRKEIA